MKKVYLDSKQSNMCMSVFMKDAEVVLAGTTVNAMSIKHKNDEYKRFAAEYDIHFIFEDNFPEVDFYTIPMVDIFAVDSFGGYIGSIGQYTDLQKDIPICYIDSEKNGYLIAKNGAEFLNNVHHWKEQLIPYKNIEFLESYEIAQERYVFLDMSDIEQKTKYDNNEFETYKAEVQEKWGETDAYKRYAQKTKNYSKQKWNDLAVDMDHVMAAFAVCMKKNERPDSAETQKLVKMLQNHISENYYLCTNEILLGLGKMYVADERFKNNIDKHADGTAQFVCEAIEVYCYNEF